jgi:hypothetical protein
MSQRVAVHGRLSQATAVASRTRIEAPRDAYMNDGWAGGELAMNACVRLLPASICFALGVLTGSGSVTDEIKHMVKVMAAKEGKRLVKRLIEATKQKHDQNGNTEG